MQSQTSVLMQIPLMFLDVLNSLWSCGKTETEAQGAEPLLYRPTKQPCEKPHQFQPRQVPSHRLGSHNAAGPYLQRQEEGSLICAGWKHSHHVMDKINCCPPQSMQHLACCSAASSLTTILCGLWWWCEASMRPGWTRMITGHMLVSWCR